MPIEIVGLVYRTLLIALLATGPVIGCNGTPGDWSLEGGGGGEESGHADAGYSDSGGDEDGGWASSDYRWEETGGSADSGGSDWGSWVHADAGEDVAGGADSGAPTGNTNVNLSGSGDFGFFRRQMADGVVPVPGTFDADGFFAEHHTSLPPPSCGERICLQAFLGVMGNLINGVNCTLLQLSLNSPVIADPGSRPPLTLAVVVDVSGSMQGASKIEFVRNGLELLIDSMHDDDQLALITYSDIVQVVWEMDSVADNRAELRGIVRALRANGGTDLYGGLERGFQEVQDAYDSGRQNRVIMLSDGQPTSGVTDEQAILDMSRAYNSDGMGLTTIGLGTDFNTALMRTLAQQADGNVYFLENAAAVDEVFSEEISYFTVPVAFDLQLEVREGDRYEFGRAYGSAFWERTEGGGRLDVPSVFLAHRESHDDVRDDPEGGGSGRRGGGSALLVELMPRDLFDDGSGITNADVAIIDVRFREPGTNDIIEDHIVVNYPHAPWLLTREGWFGAVEQQLTIQKSFVMLNIYVGIESACQTFYNGAPNEAISIIRRLIAAVEDFNEEIDDVDMAYDLELMGDLISVMEDNGAEDPEDELPDDPWPAD
jgi:Ca-activated chloride channel family protein